MTLVRTSKFLSLVLRHRPDKIGIELDPAGWVRIDDLIAAMTAHGHPVTREELDAVVADNDKRRFVVDRTGDWIRANQGHSVTVDLGLPKSEPPSVLFHGTPSRNVEAILRGGLMKQRRHAVHLSADRETAYRVGARRGQPAIFRVDADRMDADGHPFFLSENGVWLTEHVPPQYLSLVDPTTDDS